MLSGGDVVEVSGMQTAANSEMTIEAALREVLKSAVTHDAISRGLRECIKALDRGKAFICVLAESCNEASYVKLVEALCAEGNINLIKVADAKQLGEWVGFCKIDKKGEVRKVVGCSCVVVRELSEESVASRALMDHFKALTQ